MRTIQKAKPERELARRRGETTYFTGRPCKHGHVSPRNTADGSCVGCREAFRAVYRDEAREYIRDKRKRMLAEDAEGTRRKQRRRQQIERILEPDRVRERDRRNGRIKRTRHPDRKLAEVRRRQAAKLNRTPPWADQDAIREFYVRCPPGHEVDHVIPLRGDLASGLHVETNLQILLAEENRLKGNRVTPEMLARVRRQMLTELLA